MKQRFSTEASHFCRFFPTRDLSAHEDGGPKAANGCRCLSLSTMSQFLCVYLPILLKEILRKLENIDIYMSHYFEFDVYIYIYILYTYIAIVLNRVSQCFIVLLAPNHPMPACDLCPSKYRPRPLHWLSPHIVASSHRTFRILKLYEKTTKPRTCLAYSWWIRSE